MKSTIQLFSILLLTLSTTIACDSRPEEAASTPSITQPDPWADGFKKFSGILGLSPSFTQIQTQHDFNGDGQPDYLYFATVTTKQNNIPDAVQIVPLRAESSATADLLSGSKNVIVIVHGGNIASYIIRDTEEVSILDSPAAEEAFAMAKSEINSIDQPHVEGGARGDIIVLPTAAGIDTYLYFDGTRYVLFEPMEMP